MIEEFVVGTIALFILWLIGYIVYKIFLSEEKVNFIKGGFMGLFFICFIAFFIICILLIIYLLGKWIINTFGLGL